MFDSSKSSAYNSYSELRIVALLAKKIRKRNCMCICLYIFFKVFFLLSLKLSLVYLVYKYQPYYTKILTSWQKLNKFKKDYLTFLAEARRKIHAGFSKFMIIFIKIVTRLIKQWCHLRTSLHFDSLIFTSHYMKLSSVFVFCSRA